MADKLVHPVLKRGHTNWMESSHSVLMTFRQKHISMERLHYHVSTNLGLLQANMTPEYTQQGPKYHWKLDLFQRLGLPEYDGVRKTLEVLNRRRINVLNCAKTEKAKRRRVELKCRRTKDQHERKLWSQRHGRDTYGDDADDTNKDEEGKKPCNKCGSVTHSRSTHKDCPYNGKRHTNDGDDNVDAPEPQTDNPQDVTSKHCLSPGSCGSPLHTDGLCEISSGDETDCDLFSLDDELDTDRDELDADGDELDTDGLEEMIDLTNTPSECSQHTDERWIRNSLFTLNQSDRCIITSPSGWLNDNIITACQKLLAQHFPDIGGLQPSVLEQIGGFQAHTGDFAQILNIGNTHWIFVSNHGCDKNVVHVYDTMYSTLPSSTIYTIARLAFCPSPTLNIKMVDVHKQKNGSDCGVLSVAIAFDVLSARAPCVANYKQNSIRDHMCECLQNCCFSAFPALSCCPRTDIEFKFSVERELYCQCRLPEQPGEDMAECEKCNEWFHRHCLDIPDGVFNEGESWECPQCKKSDLIT